MVWAAFIIGGAGNNKGMLIKKDFYDINKMNDIKLSSLKTDNKYSKKSFVFPEKYYGRLNSLAVYMEDDFFITEFVSV